MSEAVTETMDQTDQENGEFSVEEFMDNAREYMKIKSIFDGAIRLTRKKDSEVGTIEEVCELMIGLRDRLMSQVENGKGYIPRASLGFGGHSATTIAQSVLAIGKSTTELRRGFALYGKGPS